MLLKSLENQIQLNNVFHSYIFEGSEEEVRNQCVEFSKRLLNSNSEFENLVEIITPQPNIIPIDTIRELNKKVYEKPSNKNYNIYVIEKSDKMRVEAQNALLKTLEEMPSYSIIIMTTDNRFKLLDTIISRSQIISLNKAFEIDFSNEVIIQTIDLIKKSLDNNFYLINKEKNIFKVLSEDKEIVLHTLTKVFSDAFTKDVKLIDNIKYKSIIETLKNFNKIEIEEILLKIDKIKELLKVNINFQLALEDLIFNIMKINEKYRKKRR